MKPMTVYFASNRNLKEQKFSSTFHKNGPECYRVGKVTVGKKNQKYKLQSVSIAPETSHPSGEDIASELGSSTLFAEIKKRMRIEKRDLIILIHGFSSDFDTAPERAAEIADKYAIKGKDGVKRSPIPFVFSWPANGRLIPFKSYVSDRNDAAQSGRAIARLFLRLCDFFIDEARQARSEITTTKRFTHEPCNQQIHLVAHSMGNQALSSTLQAIIEFRGTDKIPSIFDNIFLMAADEDDDALHDPKKMGFLSKLGNAIHVYHSKDDQALVISDLTKLNPDRLGSNGPENMDLVHDKVVAIDCRHVDHTDLSHANHQYYRLRKEVIKDINFVLSGIPADKIPNRHALQQKNRYLIQNPHAK